MQGEIVCLTDSWWTFQSSGVVRGRLQHLAMDEFKDCMVKEYVF